MEFTFPELDEVGYRLWRLRRLILISGLLPVLVWLLVSLVAWPFTGSPPGGLIALYLFSVLVLGLHAMLFPNATLETQAIAVGLAFMALVEPLIGFSLVLRLLELIAFVGIVLFGQWPLLALAERTPGRAFTFRAKVLSEKIATDARVRYAPRPGQELSRRLCGSVDAAGYFPVTTAGHDPVSRDMTEAGTQKFWGKVERDDPAFQVTGFFDREADGTMTRMTTVEHHFKPGSEGCLVSETEKVEYYPFGVALVFWLVDYQQDCLIDMRDSIEGRTSMALRAVPRITLAQLITQTLRPRWSAMGR